MDKTDRLLKQLNVQPIAGSGDAAFVLPNPSGTVNFLNRGGTQGGLLHHGVLDGLGDDDHTQYQKETDFTAGSVLFRGASVIDQKNASFFWDNTNNRLGIGTAAPAYQLQVGDGDSISCSIGSDITAIPAAKPGIFTTDGAGAYPFNTYGNLVIKSRTNTGGGRKILFYTTAATGGTEVMQITGLGLVGIGTNAPDRQLEINEASGNCLRLTYNDSNGSAANYADFQVSSGGDLTISASGGDISFSNENLATTGSMTAASFSAGASAGVSGSFTTADGKTVTVTSGIITSIV